MVATELSASLLNEEVLMASASVGLLLLVVPPVRVVMRVGVNFSIVVIWTVFCDAYNSR